MATDPERSTPGWRENWLTVAVVAVLVTSAMGVGIVAGGESAELTPTTEVNPAIALTGAGSLADADTKLTGAGTNDDFGAALTHGDVNGDGIEDVLVGAPRNNTPNGNGSGAVYVFYGPVVDREIDAESANATLYGVEGGDGAGYSLAAGDVDDDGTDDIVVGAPFEETGADDAGAVYVVYGGSLENRSLADANHTFYGESYGDHAGRSVATVNRTDGDDVLVGASGNDIAAEDAGAVYVISGADPGTLNLTNATPTLTGEGPGDRAGWSLDGIGDFDGDGSNDFVVGAPNNSSTAADAGAAYVITANVSGTESLSNATLKLAGENASDRAGWAAAEAGDVDDDGYVDVVIGAPFADATGNDSGIAYVVYGDDDTTGTANLSAVGTVIAGEEAGDYTGYSVSSAGSGDVTCDDYADVLVGAPGANTTAEDAGAVYLLAGGEDREDERSLSDADGTFVGEGEGDHAGYAVSDAMDATGDGDEDVLVGAPGNDTAAGNDSGAAYLLAGDCPEPTPTPTETATPTPTETATPKPELEDLDVAKKCADGDGEVTITNPNDVRVVLTFDDEEYHLAPEGKSGD
ncbi:integrin alpha, partial [Halolamina litorea]